MTKMTYNAFMKEFAKHDIEHVVARFKEETGAADAQCVRAQDLYTKFLYLSKKYADMKLVPPKLADELWHRHILFTKSYAECCENLVGRFLHHNPNTDDDPMYQKAWMKTIELYQKEFQDFLGTRQGGSGLCFLSPSACVN
jgi:hypothetical protein